MTAERPEAGGGIDTEIARRTATRAVSVMADGDGPHVTGGGGAGGTWLFTDLAGLDSLIADATRERDGIAADGARLTRARELIRPAAPDLMSRMQADAFDSTLVLAYGQNSGMHREAQAQLDKLMSARDRYAAVERANEARFTR